METLDSIILGLISLSSVFSIAAWTGFLPAKWTRYFSRNRAEETLIVLEKFGIYPDEYLKRNLAKSIPHFADANNIEKTLNELLARCTIEEKVGVGNIEQIEVQKYVDAMSMSTDPQHAELLARHLTTFWRKLLTKESTMIKNPRFDLVVTPKGGSPLLGYEFSKIMQTPFALHTSDNKKFHSKNEKLFFHSLFDCHNTPKEGATALIVDDSATGGRKVLAAISALKRCGIKVTDCLVLFEPTIKGVRTRLNEQGIALHAIVQR